MDVAHRFAGRSALGQQDARAADVPVVLVQLQRDQLGVALLAQVEAVQEGRLAVSDTVDTATAAVDAIVVVTLAIVAPIGYVNGTFGAADQGEAAKPGVVAGQEIGSMTAHVAAAAPLHHVAVEPIAVQVAGKQTVAILVRPVIAKIKQTAGVGMAAAGDTVRPLPPRNDVQLPPPQWRWSEVASMRS